MLILSIATENYDEALHQVVEAQTKPIDAVELRLDYFNPLNKTAIQQLVATCQHPIIFTLRKRDQGGKYQGTEEELLEAIQDLSNLNPHYWDIEYDVPPEFVTEFKTKFPKIELICSYHNFELTPNHLSSILQSMRHPAISIYKIATMAHSTLDSLKMLSFVKSMSSTIKLAGMCMGECGSVSRILAPLVQSALTYTSLSKNTLGQIDVVELTKTYRYQQLSPNTKIYALLGDPIEYSIGHYFHNDQLANHNQDAVYVKMKLKTEELKDFFLLAKQFPFYGLSITMPLKIAILPYVNSFSESAKRIQAINTITLKESIWFGDNTDGIGVLNLVEEIISVKNKHIVMIGAGGTSRAIISEAIKRGAKVTILNRSIKHGNQLAEEFHCSFIPLSKAERIIREGYDVMINATPVGMQNGIQGLPLQEEFILPHTILLDMVSNPEETLFLKTGRIKNCHCISGKRAFYYQAMEQERIWGII